MRRDVRACPTRIPRRTARIRGPIARLTRGTGTVQLTVTAGIPRRGTVATLSDLGRLTRVGQQSAAVRSRLRLGRTRAQTLTTSRFQSRRKMSRVTFGRVGCRAGGVEHATRGRPGTTNLRLARIRLTRGVVAGRRKRNSERRYRNRRRHLIRRGCCLPSETTWGADPATDFG